MTNKQRTYSKSGMNSVTTGYESNLWRMADALRGTMDSAEYKHVVLGLIFLKYISDAFEEVYAHLKAEQAEGADPEDPDEYRAKNAFWVPARSKMAPTTIECKTTFYRWNCRRSNDRC